MPLWFIHWWQYEFSSFWSSAIMNHYNPCLWNLTSFILYFTKMLSIVLLIFYFLMFQFQIMSDTIDFSSLVFNICGVQCKSNTSLRKHTKGVHDDRQFSFQFRLRLRKHINSHSKRKCNICGYKAKTESKLTHHLEKKHVPAIKPVGQLSKLNPTPPY